MIVAFTFVAAVAQPLFKTGANRLSANPSIAGLATDIPLIAGLVLYAFGSVLMIACAPPRGTVCALSDHFPELCVGRYSFRHYFSRQDDSGANQRHSYDHCGRFSYGKAGTQVSEYPGFLNCVGGFRLRCW